MHFYAACSVEQELTIIFTKNIQLIHKIFENIIFLCKNIWMNGETLPRLVGASIIKVALTKKLSIYVVWCITMSPNNCTCVILQQ